MNSKTSAALLLVGVFLLGAITGAVSHSLYRRHTEAASSKVGRRPPGTHDITEELARGLNLDPAQKENLKIIVSQSRDRYRTLATQFRPQYEAIRKETREQIRQILREDQKARFEENIQEIDKRLSGRSPRHNKR